jgi:hypothetical protein
VADACKLNVEDAGDLLLLRDWIFEKLGTPYMWIMMIHMHWPWKFLKDETKLFVPLHKVFAKIKVDSLDSGTTAWTEIFLLYPITGVSIAHKLLARGLKTCLGFKDDSTAAATDYIASINASASQLSHM